MSPRACGYGLCRSHGASALEPRDVRGSRHARVAAADGTALDPIRDTNWVPAMDEFVGREARVMALWRLDVAGCPVVAVDVDDGHWLWRVRDLRAP